MCRWKPRSLGYWLGQVGGIISSGRQVSCWMQLLDELKAESYGIHTVCIRVEEVERYRLRMG